MNKSLTTVLLRRYSRFSPSQSSSYNRFASPQASLPINTVINFVPQQEAWVVERFGRFNKILEPGLTFLFPFIDQIRYVKTLKEVAVETR